MTLRPLLSTISLFSVLLLFVFFIPDLEARGRGGKSFSRHGHASSGSFRGGGHQRREVRSDHRRAANRRAHRRRNIRIGTRLTIGSYNALTCRRTIIVHGGITYYGCGTVWYNQVYYGGQVTYIVVESPPGY
jgi:hypothetical protein